MQPKIVELVVGWGGSEDIRVIRKVRQTQHQNPEFGHTQGEILKKPAKKYISIQGGWGVKTINFGGKLSFILSFRFPERLHCCYIYFHCSKCTTTIISLETCALNAEFEHFLLRCSISYWDLIKCPYFADTTERGDGGWKEAQTQGEDRVTLRITLLLRKVLKKFLIFTISIFETHKFFRYFETHKFFALSM